MSSDIRLELTRGRAALFLEPSSSSATEAGSGLRSEKIAELVL
jgi:hypothetical protein